MGSLRDLDIALAIELPGVFLRWILGHLDTELARLFDCPDVDPSEVTGAGYNLGDSFLLQESPDPTPGLLLPEPGELRSLRPNNADDHGLLQKLGSPKAPQFPVADTLVRTSSDLSCRRHVLFGAET
jgi:hypothetical protein